MKDLTIEIIKLLLPFIGIGIGWLFSLIAKRSENKRLRYLLIQQSRNLLLLRDQIEFYKKVTLENKRSNQFRNTRNSAYRDGEYSEYYQDLKYTGTLSPTKIITLIKRYDHKE